MLLSDADLFGAIDSDRLILHPYREDLVQPSSIDVRLGNSFRIFPREATGCIDPRSTVDATELVKIEGDDEPFILRPGEFALGHTVEWVTLNDDLVARLEGKSSLGRFGLLIHATAGFVDAGFSGQVTLELFNLSPLPIKLWPGMRVAQLCVFQLSSPALRSYAETGRYQGQRGPTPSRAVSS